MTAGIFISYRRQDAIKDARAVFERLGREFGPRNVFMDLEGLAYGEDFVDSLERHLSHCRVMLALIGPKWLALADGQGRRRLDDPDDFVRIELRTALARHGVRVVPVLLDGAELPPAAELPEDLRALRRRQAFSLRDMAFDADMRQLCANLRPVLEAAEHEAKPAPLVAAHTPPEVAQAPAPKPRPVPRVARSTAEASAARPRPPKAKAPAPESTPIAPTPSLTSAKPTWARAEGRDEFGRWAEFAVGSVVQRLRWIEPGEFMMGSPTTEAERNDNEGPQHRVRITQGFWLADTACTQALWLAVIGGKNPAKFQDDPQNPVEQVSHEDVTRFLQTLRGRLAGQPAVVLPTEAQWEYACRAGTTTPFSLGATVTPEQVNYNEYLSYAGGGKRWFRERTVAVKALPANRWGLYQMHGNVWEWCADGMRLYADVPVGQSLDNPIGPQEQGPEAMRAVRGGSWLYGAGGTRSAHRFAFRRVVRLGYLGFRFALMS